MLTKTKTKLEKENDLATGHSFSIPKNIQKEIEEKWFHLYNWIWEKDVKQSIERDFLKNIKKFWVPLAATLIIPSIILLYMGMEAVFYLYFFWLLSFINIVLLTYLTTIAIKRSSILRKNAYVLITDSSVSINWKIRDLKDNSIVSNDNLQEIWTLFEEEIFKKSNIHKTKKWFRKQVTEQLTNWFSAILKMWKSRSKKTWEIVLVLLVLYSIYAFSLWIIYFIWIFFIWIFWNLLSFINKRILLATGHEVTTIKNHFENIDDDSKNLEKEKNSLAKSLSDAINNDWKDSLLKNINSGIEEISSLANSAIDTSVELKKEIQNSRYKQMFNFSIYNSWIKKQIYDPLKQVMILLDTNLKWLNQNLENIGHQLKTTSTASLEWPLVASKARTLMKIEDIKKHKIKIEYYLQKLQ